MLTGENLEVACLAACLAVGLDVVADQLRPRTSHGGVVFLRGIRLRGEMPEPAAEPCGRRAGAVAAHGQVGEVDVLAMAEAAARRHDRLQELSQLGREPAVMARRGHCHPCDSAAVTAKKPASCCLLTPARADRSSEIMADCTASDACRPAGVRLMMTDRRSL